MNDNLRQLLINLKLIRLLEILDEELARAEGIGPANAVTPQSLTPAAPCHPRPGPSQPSAATLPLNHRRQPQVLA